MRHTALALLLCLSGGLAGCGPEVAGGVLVGANVATVATFQRSPPDILVSYLTGKDCSIVRLDRGETYCALPDQVRRQPFCTRSLGTVDCWADPEHLPGIYRQVGDAPAPLPAQEQWRRAPWPKQVNVGL